MRLSFSKAMDLLEVFNKEACVIIGGLSVLTALLLFRWYQIPKNFPPGPRGFPFVGILPWLEPPAVRMFKKWSKVYGPVISVRIGSNDWVVLNDYESVNTVKTTTIISVA